MTNEANMEKLVGDLKTLSHDAEAMPHARSEPRALKTQVREIKTTRERQDYDKRSQHGKAGGRLEAAVARRGGHAARHRRAGGRENDGTAGTFSLDARIRQGHLPADRGKDRRRREGRGQNHSGTSL